MKTQFACMTMLAAALLMAGCAKEDGGSTPGPETNGGFFDFKTTQNHNLSVDYNLNGYTSGILFEVYAENPDQVTTTSEGEVRSVRRTDVKPIFKGVTTAAGKFTGVISVPTYVKKLYFRTDWIVAAPSVDVDVTAGAISVDMKSASVARGVSRATTASGYTIKPANVYPLNDGDWDAKGLPSWLAGREQVPANLTADIGKVLKPGRNLGIFRPELVDNELTNHNITLVKAAEVTMTYLGASANWPNVVGYYHYPTATPPASPADITRLTLAFPHAKAAAGLVQGDYVKLMYWDAAQSKYVAQFPAGTTIGFFLIPAGFNTATGNIAPVSYAQLCYSDARLNMYGQTPDQDRRQQTVALYNYSGDDRNVVVLGFEDRTRGIASVYNDHDFDDMLFYAKANPADAIKIPDDRDPDELDPEDPTPTPKPYELEYEGTLAFEDLWPWRGDYDMNDVGLTYYSKVYFTADNKVYKVEDTFTPVCKGGQHTNGFGYQYGVDVAKVKSCVVTAVPSAAALAEGKSAPVNPFGKRADSDLESNQTKAVVMLYGDVKEQLSGTAADKDKSKQKSYFSYNVTTELSNVTIDELTFPPYNPFIVVQPAGTNEEQRAREIHLTNFAPTDKGTDPNNLWFGKGHDKSDRMQYWYISDWAFPFAINVPTTNFEFPQENQRIDAAFPKFASWAASYGAQDADWYEK